MKRGSKRSDKPIRYRLPALLVLLAVTHGPAQSNDSPHTDWNCERCRPAAGWELDIEGGPAYVTDDAFRFGNYSGLDDSGGYLFGDVFGRYRDDDAHYALLEGYGRGTDSGGLFMRGGKQSLYELRASWQSIPQRQFDSAITPYLGNDTEKLTLPTSWVRAPVTGQMTALASTTAPVLIGRNRDIYGLGFELSPWRHWNIQADYRRSEREGLQRTGGSFLFNAAEFATPINYISDDYELALAYSAATWQTSISYFGSTFTNKYRSLTWDNPYTGAAAAGQLALPPDNEAHRFTLSGSVLLPARTTLNGQLSFGRMQQNESLLPYTTNTLIPTNPLPANSANAEAETLNMNIRAVSSPWRKFTLEGELRYRDTDNQTPVNIFDYVITDTVRATTPSSGSAYDYERRDIKLRGEYRLTDGMKLHAGFDNERFERNRQDRSHTTTNRLWFRLRTRLGQDADLNLDLFTEDRDGSSYTTVENSAEPENPLMRKFNMANRERNGIKLRGTVVGGERTDLGWEFEYGEDRYNDSLLGLTEGDYVRVGADLTHSFGSAAAAYASVYNEEYSTDQRNSQTFSEPDWLATSDDNFTTATVGLTYPEFFRRLDATIEYTWSNSVGKMRNDTSGLTSAFPELRSKRQNITLGLRYPYSESISIGLDYMFEALDSHDWALDDVEPDTVNNLLALGADAWNYNTSVIYLNVRYQLQPF